MPDADPSLQFDQQQMMLIIDSHQSIKRDAKVDYDVDAHGSHVGLSLKKGECTSLRKAENN
jgi:uncharacterized membrane protein